MSVLVLVVLLWCGAAAGGGGGEVRHLSAAVGGFAVMDCHLDFPFGHEIPYHLQWDKDGETIFSWYSGEGTPRVAERWAGRVRRVAAKQGLGGGSVNITSVRESDAGLYRCRVAFPNRTPPARNNGTFYYLDVDGGNLILTPPTNATVLEGQRAELECSPKSPEWSVRWFKDGLPVDSLPELAARAELPANGSLVLPAASSADAGEYSCRVTAPDLPDQHAAAFLDVQYKAKVVYSPGERFLPLGKGASLDCHFSANPPLTNLRWEKDGFLFDPYNVPGVFYSRNGSLLFNQVDESHEGEYSCTPYNALGTAGPSARVRVRVQRPPALAVRPQPLYAARLGQRLTLPCSPHVSPRLPPPDILWTRKDGRPLPPHSLSGGNLTLESVDADAAGVYVCGASNEAAHVSAETELLVENLPPRAPHSLTAAPRASSVHLSWQPGNSGVEAQYEVWYRGEDEAEWHSMRLLSAGVTQATLLGLRPNTRYELRVLATDHIGDGLFSKPIHVRTTDAEGYSLGETAQAAATTVQMPVEGEDGEEGGEEGLQVSVRLLEEGALVRWSRAPHADSRCTVRWVQVTPPEDRLLTTMHTHHDYVLVSSVEEGAEYSARVWCGGAGGRAALRVPEYGRLRAVAAGAAVAALLLAALAAALYLARRRLCARTTSTSTRTPPYTPAVPPRADKRRF